MRGFAAFIFDLDGLVLDTELTYFAAWKEALKLLGYELNQDSFQALSGRHYSQVREYLVDVYGRDFDLERFHELGRAAWHNYVEQNGIPVKPGVLQLLAYARRKQIPVCIATNSAGVYARKCLEIAGLSSHFPLLISGDEVERVKPEPDIFLKAAELLGMNIAQCLVFEDSPTGVTAAVKAGACTVFVPSVLPADARALALSDYHLESLAQAFEILLPDRDIMPD